MIFLAGDIHGEMEVGKVAEYIGRIAAEEKLTQEDHLILLGDVGVCWDGGKRDAYVRSVLEALPVTTLWIDGNHENFDLIDALPQRDWNGGRVQFIGSKIIHLMRGYVYRIEDRSFFAFGGGLSIDRMYRREGVSWWSREMPSAQEYERGRKSLEEADFKADYIITHTVPSRIARKLVPNLFAGEEELQAYLQEIALNVEFKKWFFGHWHMDCEIDDYIGLYDNIVRLEARGKSAEQDATFTEPCI